jgi:DNA-binding transcriptional regulator YiaG
MKHTKRKDQDWPRFVKELRKRSMTTQKELAERLGVSKITVSRWERKAAMPMLRHRREMLQISDEVR